MIEKNILKLLSIKSWSTEELRKKLVSKGFDLDAIELALKKMQDLGYLNDEELAKRRFQLLVNKGYGPRYVALKMREQGLKMPPYAEALQKEVARRFLSKGSFLKKERRRCGAALQRRGFDLEVIYAVLGEACASG